MHLYILLFVIFTHYVTSMLLLKDEERLYLNMLVREEIVDKYICKYMEEFNDLKTMTLNEFLDKKTDILRALPIKHEGSGIVDICYLDISNSVLRRFHVDSNRVPTSST
jgi:hypothetical protein